jgi:His-Xaa-Ser system radical SAM maturase HxsB
VLNHLNFKQQADGFLLTNDLGMYTFATADEFRKLITGTLTSDDACYREMHDKFFFSDKPREVFVTEAVRHLRTLKSYEFSSTALHIFAVTNSCNMNCVYCQAKATHSMRSGFMSVETGLKAVELAMQSPSKYLTFEFQGGEPLLNFEVVKAMIAHSKEINTSKKIQYTIVTNLVSLDKNILEYLLAENVSICTSVDGCAELHNKNRQINKGEGSFDLVKNSIETIRAAGGQASAIQTTSHESLKYPIETVDTYIQLGINGIFLRPLTPLGIARANWDVLGYSPEEFLAYYRVALDRIMEINLSGKHFPELHASYFLKKILGGYSDNYMELRSPCGASIGQMSYYYDGNVYTCDEGRMLSEMGDSAFQLGNVYEHTYDQMMNSTMCKATCAASVVESLPHCCDCAYHPYCGVCPVVAYADSADIFPKSPRDYRCKIYMGILDILFEKLRKGNEEILGVFRQWIEV